MATESCMTPAGAILDTEFSERFIQAMRARMIVSYHKYGPLADAYPEKVNAIATLRRCLRAYEQTGNQEYLVDAGNYAMIEFMIPAHPKAHWDVAAKSAKRAWQPDDTDGTEETSERANDGTPVMT